MKPLTSDHEEAFAFIEGIKEKVILLVLLLVLLLLLLLLFQVKNDLEAKVLCMIEIGRIKLRAQLMDDVKVCYQTSPYTLTLNPPPPPPLPFPSCQTIIEESSELLDTVDGITSVHSRYYELSSEYYKVSIYTYIHSYIHTYIIHTYIHT